MSDGGRAVRLTIDDVAYGGKGVARHAGKVVFLYGVLPGEVVDARIVREAARFDEAELIAVHEASPQRVVPPCPLAGRCPGCRYQHATYAEELRLKQKQFADLLARLGGVSASVCEVPVGSALPLGYRNKIMLHAWREGAGEGLALGFFSEDNRTVLDVPVCLLASDRIRAHQEGLRRDADFMASLSTHNKVTVRETQADGVVHWVGATPGQGRPWLTERTAIGDLKVPRGGFFQVNPEVASVLLARVSAEIELQRPGEVLDLYTGVGIFALAAVRAGVSRVTGIDYDGPAIEAARINASQLSGGAAVRFVAGPVSGRIASALRDCRADDACVIVDPPRMGMDKSVRDQLVRHRPAMVVYVSCAPDTLARDLAHLTAAGYRVKRATLMDMFPRTSHFESLTVLRRG